MTQKRRAPLFSRLLGSALAAATAVSLFALPAQATAPQKKPRPTTVQSAADGCLDAILAAEKELSIPAGLLLSVSLVESGQNGTPAPYAVNVQGRSLFPKTEREAASHLRDDKGKLRRNVYAGCMQLSVAHHKNSFRPVEKIVNPAENVRYAARYLVRLRQETGSWAAAVARYNGGTGDRRQHYQCQVHRQLAALGAPSADLIDGRRCKADKVVEIAPKTRRAFQVAAGLPVS
ncbi:transglycosylase SLT domain-containing protein [Indioceanicola profundi]|uniref:transglycosylase SLT domain-containing protein n=1 Tax=Indioceanicola profundi TaxID=2220096 RepID=UPI000E6A9BE7|nr:transglycosylase SLT domain-containing protein [Indioceanicola profundi]